MTGSECRLARKFYSAKMAVRPTLCERMALNFFSIDIVGLVLAKRRSTKNVRTSREFYHQNKRLEENVFIISSAKGK